MRQPKCGEVRGCCVLWCAYPLPRRIIPHSGRKPPECGDTPAGMSASLSLQGKVETPQSYEGSSGSCQLMTWRSEGTERTQRSGAWWSIDWLLLRPSGPQRMWLSFQTWQRGKAHKNCLYCGRKNPCISRKWVPYVNAATVNLPIISWMSLWIIAQNTLITYRSLQWHTDMVYMGILYINWRNAGYILQCCERLSHTGFSSIESR